MTEYRYTDIEFTDSDRLIYKAQVATDTIGVIDKLEEQFSKELPQDLEGGTDEEPTEDVSTDETLD